MSKDMLTRVIGCKSSFQIWDKIHAYFHAHTNAKARQLRGDLRGTTLDNRSISDYLLCIQTLVDALTAIGNPVSPKEHLDIVLEGLLEEYESTVSLISNRFDELTIEEVETLLLAHESRLEKFKKKLEISSSSNSSPLPPQADLTHQDSQFPSSRGGRPGARYGRGGRSNNRYGHGRGRFAGAQCQVCHRYGHIASSCYYRFDSNFVPTLPFDNSFSAADPTTNPALGYNPSPFHSQPATCPTRSSNGILGPRPLNPTSSQAYLVSTGDHQAQASPMAMTAFSPGSNLWYPDSGASNHVTNMSHNIQQFTPFEGPDQIIIRNGQGLPINSSGVAAFPSPLKPHISLTLNNLIYVPNITKNLISVSQFCKDNSVFFEFHSTCCLVKSQDTKDTLLMGVVGPDGLYQFPSLLRPRQQSVITPSANTTSCNSVPYATWHSRLGHPHNDVMKSVFRLCNFPIMNKTVSDFCTPCCLGKSHKLPSTLSKTVYHTPFELIYSDLWGPAPITSDNGYQYYVTFVDAHTRFT
uniref:Retrovirus-related Pol polyprotein from transposon TNT 1-94 n=1 Tax=Cajanus cajan TaxID=3821 RepID=A0A151U7H2_CAJCA|nr:Retrovirus-related Pol polyprotein from transposon TNT 1-94 [Cajanus cajan]KYP75240.1 Retrovirus-related Pol polyprotein from transposon TNT 1-94 [Cajanus cajan]